MRIQTTITSIASLAISATLLGHSALAQETDVTQTPNAANAGIKKSFVEQIGAGRGDLMTPGSSSFIINRDPFRAIVRGRQLFQRKFQVAQGSGPRTGDGVGDINTELSIGAGLADSCAACHGRPQGSAGFGGAVFTRPASRDAPHLFGLGLVEMLGDEITGDLRAIRDSAVSQAATAGSDVTLNLTSKGIAYGRITSSATGVLDTSGVQGVDDDLRVRPFFAHGETVSIREFIVGAFNAEMGLESPDPDLLAAATGSDVETPSGFQLTGSEDFVEGPPAVDVFDDPDLDGIVNEIPESIVDFMEFYLLNYFKPGVRTAKSSGVLVDQGAIEGLRLFNSIGCGACHVNNLTIQNDRRVADVDTNLDLLQGNPLNNLFSDAAVLFTEVDDGSGFPTLKVPSGNSFQVDNFFSDLKRHDLGPNFWERNFDDSIRKEFITEPLWGVASTAPYGHDGRSPSLSDVILRHGGEAQASRDAFESLNLIRRDRILRFLRTLVIFSPPATASALGPKVPSTLNYPLDGHGSIDLSVLFNDPFDKE